MREIFSEIFSGEAADPIAAARRSVRPQLQRRFYEHAQVAEGRDGFDVLLDGKPVQTPARRVLAAPTRALAEAVAAEWQAQREFVDPGRMALTRLANTIIDGVVDTRAAVKSEIVKYLGSDLLFYRANAPEGLRARQERHWNPLLDWARAAFGAHFVPAEGVVHVAQPENALGKAAGAIPDDAWQLGALHSITTLTGSALIALALLRGRLSIAEAWAAAHVDEDFQMEQWGRDELAMQRRDFRLKEMTAAVMVLMLQSA